MRYPESQEQRMQLKSGGLSLTRHIPKMRDSRYSCGERERQTDRCSQGKGDKQQEGWLRASLV